MPQWTQFLHLIVFEADHTYEYEPFDLVVVVTSPDVVVAGEIQRRIEARSRLRHVLVRKRDSVIPHD